MTRTTKLVAIWIDWYAYHHARFRALAEHDALRAHAAGIELVGGDGVHAGLRFRDDRDGRWPVHTILPDANWTTTNQWRLGRLLWRKLNELKPQVVLVPGYYTLPALMAAVWARTHHARAVLMSESTEADQVRRRWRETLKCVAIRGLFDVAIVGGTRHREYLEGLGFDAARIAIGYDVVDNRFFAEGARRYRDDGRPPGFAAPSHYFLYVGRLAAEKNVDGLLRSFATYRRQGGTWDLVLVGDGPCRPALAELATELDVAAHVIFAGHRSTEALLPFYAFASAFVLPSRIEPWGLVINEAMASALPVLVSRRCGAAADVIREGDNGFTFDPDSAGDLTRLLERVSALPARALQAMGQRSTEIIEMFSPGRWADEVVRLADL